MPLSKKDIFYAKLNSIKSTIEKASVEQKKAHIAIHLAENFNDLIIEISETFPDLKDSMPKRIISSGTYHRFKQADITYLDLEIYAETTLSLLNLIEN